MLLCDNQWKIDSAIIRVRTRSSPTTGHKSHQTAAEPVWFILLEGQNVFDDTEQTKKKRRTRQN